MTSIGRCRPSIGPKAEVDGVEQALLQCALWFKVWRTPARPALTVLQEIALKPQFVFIGPTRSGTTWIDAYLRTRSDIALPEHQKETFFFDKLYERGLNWCERSFRNRGPGRCASRLLPLCSESRRRQSGWRRIRPGCRSSAPCAIPLIAPCPTTSTISKQVTGMSVLSRCTMPTHAHPDIIRAPERDREPLPSCVERDFREYLACGILAYGFARARCSGCGHDFLIAYSCKGRGVCPSCNTRRMAQTAAHLVDHEFPQVPVRQWVLSLPKGLRYFLPHDPARARSSVFSNASASRQPRPPLPPPAARRDSIR